MPRFSVIISVYNKGNFIAKTIESVLDQSIDDYEIIIVNDSSIDNSEEVIQSFQSNKIIYHALKENQGAAAARNKGIEIATGTYIALLDGDDIWDKNYLKEINLLIDKFPNHKVFATALTIQDHDGKRTAKYTFSNEEDKTYLSLNYFDSSLKNSILHSSATVVEKSIFKTTGNFDITIKSGQDTDLWIRVGLKYPIAFSTQPLVLYTDAPKSLFKSIKTVKDRPNFVAYEDLEKNNMSLKKFLDLNRFSLAIRAKLWKEPKEAQFFIHRIDVKNLSRKQQWLIQLPTPIIRALFFLKRLLEKMGIRLGVY